MVIRRDVVIIQKSIIFPACYFVSFPFLFYGFMFVLGACLRYFDCKNVRARKRRERAKTE